MAQLGEGTADSLSQAGEQGDHNIEAGFEEAPEALPRRSTQISVAREKWSNERQFLLSAIAAAVGLGNVWRFPAVCARNGGATFFIPYMFVVMFIARPLFRMELSLGQFSSCGSVRVWELSPLFTGVGYAGSLSCILLSSFYIMLLAWALIYLILSGYAMYTGELPWGEEPGRYFEGHILRSVEFNSDGNRDVWSYVPIPHLVTALFVAWLLVWASMVRGVQAGGRIAYVLAIAPYFILVILFGVGLSLPGMALGLEYLFYPHLDELLEAQTWYEAVGQCFFSLGIGFGSLIMLSSYNEFNYDLVPDALIISLVDFFTSILAGISLMAILGFHATEVAETITLGEVRKLIKGTGGQKFKDACELDELRDQKPGRTATVIDSTFGNEDKLWRDSPYKTKEWTWIVKRCELQKLVADGGAGIAFVEYPRAMIQINREWGKYLGGFLAFIFFLMLILLAVGSADAFVGTTVTIIADRKPHWKRSRIVTGVCGICFCLGLLYTNSLGSKWIDVVDTHGVTAVVYVLGFFEAVAVVYVYGLKSYCDDMAFMRVGRTVNWYLKISWVCLPLLLTVIYIAWMVTEKVPETWTLSIRIVAWLITAGGLLVIPGVMVGKIWEYKKNPWREDGGKGLMNMLKPSRHWGPKDPAIRLEWKKFKAERSPSYAFWGKLCSCCRGRKDGKGTELPVANHNVKPNDPHKAAPVKADTLDGSPSGEEGGGLSREESVLSLTPSRTRLPTKNKNNWI